MGQTGVENSAIGLSRNRGIAAQWVELIQDETTRRVAVLRVYSQWRHHDPVAATRWRTEMQRR